MPMYQFPMIGSMHQFRTPEGDFEQVVAMASFMDLLAIMIDPKQKEGECRDRLLAATHAALVPDVETEGDIEASQPSDQVKFLRQAAEIDFTKKFLNLADGRFEYGIMSGYICGWCVFHSQLLETAASATLNEACKMIYQAYARARRTGDGVDHVKKNIWGEYVYRSVAHLWAAYLLLSAIDDKWREMAFSGDVVSIENFISASEYIRELGEVHKAKNARPGDTLLRPDETWKFDRTQIEPWPDIKIGLRDSFGLGLFDARLNGWPKSEAN